MKTFWKILGLGALAVGLTPYKVEKNEETGENSYQALLWRITSTPGSAENKREIGINLGEGTLTSKLMGGEKEEAHLFSDELSVEYNGPVEETADDEAGEDASIAVDEATVAAVEEAAAEETAEKTAEAGEAE